MKLISFNKDIQIDGDADPCKKGKPYIISDGFLQQIRDNFNSDIIESIIPFKEIPQKRYNGQDLTNKSIVIWRTGGMGDLCFITPNLKYIKDTFKNSKIIFGCGPKFKYGMMNHPHVDKLIPLPIDYELLIKNDYYIMFEGIIENNEMAKKVNAYDLFEAAFGFTGKISKENKVPVLGISPEHLNKNRLIKEKFISDNKIPNDVKFIGIGLKASHIIRSIIPQHINDMIALILKNGYIPVLLGGIDDKEVANQLPNAQLNQVLHFYKYSKDYRDTISQVSLLDGIIGPDSSVVHIASACKKPVVGVYGPFPSKLRLAHYQNCSGFDIQISCGPCFLHGIETCDYSEPLTKEPLCMFVHNPELIVDELLTLMRNSM